MIFSGRESVQRGLSSRFWERWERLQVAATYNLIGQYGALWRGRSFVL